MPTDGTRGNARNRAGREGSEGLLFVLLVAVNEGEADKCEVVVVVFLDFQVVDVEDCGIALKAKVRRGNEEVWILTE